MPSSLCHPERFSTFEDYKKYWIPKVRERVLHDHSIREKMAVDGEVVPRVFKEVCYSQYGDKRELRKEVTIERKRFRFAKDKVGSQLSISWDCTAADVKNIHRLAVYYLRGYHLLY